MISSLVAPSVIVLIFLIFIKRSLIRLLLGVHKYVLLRVLREMSRMLTALARVEGSVT